MLYIPHPGKYCYRCGRLKPFNEFPKDKAKIDRLATECSECSRKRALEWRLQNPEKAKQADKRKREKQILANPDFEKERWKRRREANSERMTERARQWAQANVDKVKRSNQKWAKANREKVRELSRKNGLKRQARQLNLADTFTADDWKRALEYWHGACAYCGNPPRLWDNPRVLQQDHFIPVFRGGPYTADNILPACLYCNDSKHHKDAKEWIVSQYGSRQGARIYREILLYFKWVNEKG